VNCPVLAERRQLPATHARHATLDVDDDPPPVYVPTEHAMPAVVIEIGDATVCGTPLIVYVPAPPEPVRIAVMVVPAVTLEPVDALKT
jgi:hypothetical protein